MREVYQEKNVLYYFASLLNEEMVEFYIKKEIDVNAKEQQQYNSFDDLQKNLNIISYVTQK